MTVPAVGQREWQQPEEAPPPAVLAPAPAETAPDPRGGQGKPLDAVFWASVLAATLLLIWSTLSTSIDRVDEGVLSMARLLPPAYWAGFALLLASTILWYFGGETKAFHFLLVALWIGYLFLGPELMEAHPRGVASYIQAWGIGYVLEGRERDFSYFPWLGFHYAFAMLVELLDIGHLAMMRVGMLVMYLALALGLIAFFGRALPDKKSILVATLAALEGMTRLIQKMDSLKLIVEFFPTTLQAAGVSPQQFLERLLGLGLSVQVINEKKEPLDVHRLVAQLGSGPLVANLLCEKESL